MIRRLIAALEQLRADLSLVIAEIEAGDRAAALAEMERAAAALAATMAELRS